MKAIIEFNLDEPDDRMSHLRCVHSLDMALALWNISYNFRKSLEQMEDEGQKITADIVSDQISKIFDDNGIIIDELIN